MNMTSTPTIALNSGRTMPTTGFRLFPGNVETVESAEIVAQALRDGYRLFDTMQSYENETAVCEGILRWISEDPLHNKREDVVYTAKISSRDYTYEGAKKAIALAIGRAKSIGYIDILLNHSPQLNYLMRHEVWQAMQEAVASGKVRDIGVSNYGIHHLKELLSFPDLVNVPVVNQVELYPWLAEDELVNFCKGNNIAIEAYSPFTIGEMLDDPEVAELAKKYGESQAQIQIRWSVQREIAQLPSNQSSPKPTQNIEVLDFSSPSIELRPAKDSDDHTMLRWDPILYPLNGTWWRPTSPIVSRSIGII